MRKEDSDSETKHVNDYYTKRNPYLSRMLEMEERTTREAEENAKNELKPKLMKVKILIKMRINKDFILILNKISYNVKVIFNLIRKRVEKMIYILATSDDLLISQTILIIVLLCLAIVFCCYGIIAARKVAIAAKKFDYFVEDLTYKSEMLNSTVDTVVKVSNYIDVLKLLRNGMLKHE